MPMLSAGILPPNVMEQIGSSRMPLELQAYLREDPVHRPIALAGGALGNYPGGGEVNMRRDYEGTSEAQQFGLSYGPEHELLHLLSYEHPAWSQDARSDFSELQGAARASRGWVPSLDAWVDQTIKSGDLSHLFTGLAYLGLNDHRYLAPPLQRYFAPLLGLRQPVREQGPR